MKRNYSDLQREADYQKKKLKKKYKTNLQRDADNQGKGTELNSLTHKKTPMNKLMTMFNQAGLQQEAER